MQRNCPRITPACAGKSLISFITPALRAGSPPHVRGKDTIPQVCAGDGGITPAYAGKRKISSTCSSRTWDHPRVCGEKYQLGVVKLLSEGSPPRMRGKALGPCAGRVAVGITPAYAGKRTHRHSSCTRHRDHPRVCGEKVLTVRHYRAGKGSPPRMRGKADQTAEQLGQYGITPAYAGKRKRVGKPRPGLQDHPRVCGEKTCVIRRVRCGGGSPPRMRGKAT